MDASKYKDLVVRRGHTYHYYTTPAAPGKPTLLFIHGFPSSSFDWSRQVAYFEPKGYGLIVPDCLGYGETSKPLEYEAFRWKLMADDLIDIVNEEKPKVLVGIGHDWCVDPYSSPQSRQPTILQRFHHAGVALYSRVSRTTTKNASRRSRGSESATCHPIPYRPITTRC